MSVVTFKSNGRYGRFANQMWSMAGCLGIARKNGMTFALCEPWRNHEGLNFESDLDIDCYKRFVNPFPIYEGPELAHFGIAWGYWDVKIEHGVPNVEWFKDQGRYELRGPEGVDLLGHFQSPKFFDHCLDEVKWHFRMVNEGPLLDVCAIHWRAGDYGEQESAQHPDGNSYHPRMALSYYEPAMAQFGSKQKFLVFSDDIEGAKAMFGDRCEYSSGLDYMDDFKLLKRCSHFIIANSSYSAFAAVIGDAPDKQVVAPRPWFGGPYTGQIDGEDIYGPDWKVLNWQ